VSTITCPDCHGTGTTPGRNPSGPAIGDHPTWCRTCCGWGLFRAPEDDDEVDPPELLWPESIRWRESA
jgi:DnaJ-class molecular chaperone